MSPLARKFLTSGLGNWLSSLFWRVLVPRPVPLGTFTLLVIAILPIVGLALGTALSIAYQNIERQLAATMFLMAAALPISLGTIFVLERLRPRLAFRSHPLQTAVAIPYLIYAISGASGAIFALYVRIIIPWGFIAFPPIQNIAFVSLGILIWTAIGATASQMHERTQKKREYEVALKEKINELEASRRRIVVAQETVRQKIAGQLHGPVQTRLLILRKSLGECQGMIQSQPDRAIVMLSQVTEELDQLQKEELRGISHELHPSIIRVGLPTALRSLCDRFAPLVPITLEIEEEIDSLEDPANPSIPEDIRLALYRFAEEALNNVVKHAQASQAIAHLWQPNQGQIQLSVDDDGLGFLVEKHKPGLGILAIRDYIGAVGGTFHIESTLGKGTTLTATVVIKGMGS